MPTTDTHAHQASFFSIRGGLDAAGFVAFGGGEILDLTTLPPVVRTNRAELIVSLYENGVPVAEIAARADVCVKTVRNVARRAGLPPRNVPMPGRDSDVVHRYAQGDRVLAIASAHGISTAAVRRIAGRAGLPPRKDWRRRYPLDEGAFDRPTSTGWWLIGLLAADGSIFAADNRVSLCQATKDIDVLHAFYAYVGCPDRPVTMLRLSEEAAARQLSRGPAAEARIHSARIVHALARHGVVSRKTASMSLSDEASAKAATWLGVLDGDGSVGIYREGREPRVRFYGTKDLMSQCETFWQRELGLPGPRPRARPHAKHLWGFSLTYAKARAAARVLLGSSPTSMLRKRELLTQIAGRTS